MSVFFLDSNIIIKYYYTELGSTWIRQLLANPEHTYIISEIAIPEVAAALTQLRQHKFVGKRFVNATFEKFREDVHSGLFLKFHLNSAIIERAAELAMRHLIKGYDAIQVSSALSVQSNFLLKITFVSGDKQALSAAQSEGLLCENPFDHASKEETERPQK